MDASTVPPDDDHPEPFMARTVRRATIQELVATGGRNAPFVSVSVPRDVKGVGFGPEGRLGLAAVEDGLLRTVDGGVTWQPLPLPVEGSGPKSPHLATRQSHVRCGQVGCWREGLGSGAPYLVWGTGPDLRKGRGVFSVPPADELDPVPVVGAPSPTSSAPANGFRCAGSLPTPSEGPGLTPAHAVGRLRRGEQLEQVVDAFALSAALAVRDPDQDGTAVEARVLWGGRDARGRAFRRASGVFPIGPRTGGIDDRYFRIIAVSEGGVVAVRGAGDGARNVPGQAVWVAARAEPTPLAADSGAPWVGRFDALGPLPAGRLLIGVDADPSTGRPRSGALVIGPDGAVEGPLRTLLEGRHLFASAAHGADGDKMVVFRGGAAFALGFDDAPVFPEPLPLTPAALDACPGDPQEDATIVVIHGERLRATPLRTPFPYSLQELVLPAEGTPCLRRVLARNLPDLGEAPSPVPLRTDGSALVGPGLRCAVDEE